MAKSAQICADAFDALEQFFQDKGAATRGGASAAAGTGACGEMLVAEAGECRETPAADANENAAYAQHHAPGGESQSAAASVSNSQHLVVGGESQSAALSTSRPQPLVGLFASMKSEVNVWPLLDCIYAAGWRACFPCVPTPGHMDFFEVPESSMQAFFASGNPTDLPEFMAKPLKRFTPEQLADLGFPLVDPRDVDALVCPLVAFDATSKRLGYGGGNYDRYLEELRSDALVFGIAFSEQQVEQVPCEPHDLPLPLIIYA